MATKKQFKVFESTVHSVMDKMLPDWDYGVEFKKCPNENWDACCNYNCKTHTATITMDIHLNNKHPVSYVKKIAVHEAMHVVLAELCELAEFHGRSETIDRIEHAVINRLCNVLK